jgi:pyruvate/2-oxoglutarate dehydrogenase complex dihydrolipoamide dehydrogenase (E3) component
VVYAPWLCLGRGPDSEALGLNTVNIETDPMSGKVVVDDMDATTVPHIYCIGDAAYVNALFAGILTVKIMKCF